MAAKDLLYTCCTAFIAKGRAWIASLFDAAGDIASVLTYGVGGVVAIEHGFSWFTLLVFLSMMVGSTIGTAVGVWLSTWIERRFDIDVRSLTRRVSAR